MSSKETATACETNQPTHPASDQRSARRAAGSDVPRSLSPRVVNRIGYPAHPGAAPLPGEVAPAADLLVRASPAAPGSARDPPTSPFPGSRSGNLDILSRPSAPRLRFGGGPVPHDQLEQPGTPTHRDSPRGPARNHGTPHSRSAFSLRAFRTACRQGSRTSLPKLDPPNPALAPSKRSKLALICRSVPIRRYRRPTTRPSSFCGRW